MLILYDTVVLLKDLRVKDVPKRTLFPPCLMHGKVKQYKTSIRLRSFPCRVVCRLGILLSFLPITSIRISE